MPNNDPTPEEIRREAVAGAISAGTGYLIWGVAVIFYKQLSAMTPFAVLAHRAIWSVLLTTLLIAFFRRHSQLMALLRDRKSMMALCCSALLIGGNWLVFIYSVNASRVVETSLGYYINPLVSVLIGVALLGERLSRLQIFAIGLALLGVMNFAIALGTLPWISLFLAATFAAYGYLRKITNADPLEGLFVEVVVLLPFAAGYLWWLGATGEGVFGNGDLSTVILLVLTGPMTAVPLMLFTFGARRIRLATLGLMQYLAPTAQFLIAVGMYEEPFSAVHVVTFALIWAGLAIFSYDTWRTERELRRVIRP